MSTNHDATLLPAAVCPIVWLMRRWLAIGTVLVAITAGAVYLAVASAGDVLSAGVFELNPHHPTAGRVFTAFVVLPAPNADAVGFQSCPPATIDGKRVQTAQARFSASATPGVPSGSPNAMTCSYLIPAGTGGHVFRGLTVFPDHAQWTIRGRP